jgi:polyribonucleotide nucleotidyltransferase
MEQKLDTLSPVTTKRYMHNYNFPPFSTGETGRIGTPSRREIGHGALAERAIVPVIPSREKFPYAIRQVSEAIGSNGSTSQASVCASTLSLLNSGVPIKAPVAGIAMGLVSGEVNGETKYVTLTDILGDEDAFGDMDFKVAGTSEFVTAIQLDTKLDGIPASVLASALEQAKVARMKILNLINETIAEPSTLNATAPRIVSLKVPVDKIGEVIGPKGKTINDLQDSLNVEINVEDDGTVLIGAENEESVQKAQKAIDEIVNPYEPAMGDVFNGTVSSTTDFGAFIAITPQKDGLLHISQLKHLANGNRVNKVEEVLSAGDKVEVEVQGLDRGKVSLKIPGTESEVPPRKKSSFGKRREHGDRDRGDRDRSWK